MAVFKQRFWKGSKKAVLGLAVMGVAGIGGVGTPASGEVFSSAGTGLYNAPATWGGATDPVTSGDASDTVTINNTHVVTVTANTWMTGDALTIGTGGTLDLRNDAGTSFSLATLNISGNSAAISVSRATLGASLTHTLAGTMTLGSGGNLSVSGSNFNANQSYGLTLTGTGTVTGTQTFTVNNNGTGVGTLTVNGAIGGTGSITKAGAGLLVLGVANSFSGGLTIADGTVRFSGNVNATGNSQLGSGSITLGGGILELNAGNGDFSVARDIAMTALSTLRISGFGNKYLTYSGTFSGGAGLNVTSGGGDPFMYRFSSTSNNFGGSGNTVTLTSGGGRSLGVVLEADANLGIGANSVTFNGPDTQYIHVNSNLTSNRSYVFTTSGGFQAANNRTLTIGGTLTGTGTMTIGPVTSLPRAAAGTAPGDESVVVLAGTMTGFSGSIAVSVGRLLVNTTTSGSSNITVGPNANNFLATLGGTGNIGGSVTLNALAATNRQSRITAADIGTVGTLTIGTNLTFGHQSIMYFDMTSVASKDLINVGGTFNAASNTSNAFVRVSSGLAGGTYALVDYATAGGNLSTDRFVLQDLAGGAVDPSYSLVLDGTNTVLNLVVVSSAAVTVTPGSGSRTTGQTVVIDATADSGTYSIAFTATSGYGWSQSGISDGGPLNGTNNDRTGTLTHNLANSLNGINQGRFTTTISGASSGNGTYNYTLTRTVSGNVANVGTGNTFGTTQSATILSEAGSSNAVYGSHVGRDTDNNILGTAAEIVATGPLGTDTTITMAWRTRIESGADQEVWPGGTNRFYANPAGVFSDVVNITGLDNSLFVLRMGYKEADLQYAESLVKLGWFDASGDGKWKLAVLGNHGTNYITNYGVSEWTAIGDLTALDLGSYGVWTGTTTIDGVSYDGYVWAVLDHNSQFAVIPEPTSLALLGLGAAGLLARRRRKA